MQPGPAPGAITLWARVTDTSDPSDILDVNPTATFTYNAPPAAPGTNTSMHYTTETYPNHSIAACAPGTAPSQYGPSCATFSTYESTLHWCGPHTTGGCKAPLRDCGDGVCVRLCS
jgi:hypothetical protein